MSNGGRATRAVAALRDVVDVLVDAGRVILRHWPVLLTLAFLGVALRGAAHWSAVEISDTAGWLGQLVLVLTPLGFLIPVILMIRICASSLPHIQALAARPAPTEVTSGNERRLVHVLVSVLVPFLAVYISYGLLAQDLDNFTNSAAYDEFNQFSLSGDVEYDFAGRLSVWPLQIVAMVVAVAWVTRWALGRFESRWKFISLAAAGALVEVYYSGNVARLVERLTTDSRAWVESRESVTWVTERYDAAVGRLGFFAEPVDNTTAWLFGLLGSFDAVVVVPLAWLTVGAVVLGHKLTPPPPTRHPVLDKLTVVPAPARRVAGAITSDVRERFGALGNGLRMLAAAGLLPMVLFCLTFLIALRVPYLVELAIRSIVGPMDTNTWLALAPFENGVGLAVSMVVIAALLAAAIDRMLMPVVNDRPADARSEAAPTTAPPA